MDLQAIVQESVAKIVASGVIERTIKDRVEKAVVEAVDEHSRSYSDFGKALREAVGKSLALHGDLDLPSYNELILKVVRLQLESTTKAVVQQQVADRMEELLEPAPESIKLSELVVKFVEQVRKEESGDCLCYGEESITLEVTDDPDTRFAHYWYVRLDERDTVPRHDKHQVEIGVREEKVFSLRFRNADVEKELFAGPFYGFERMLVQMKAAGSKLIRDCEPHEIETTYTVGADV